MRRINQKITANQKSALTYSLEGKEQIRTVKNIEVLSPKLSAIEKPLQSSINSLNQSESLQKPQPN